MQALDAKVKSTIQKDEGMVEKTLSQSLTFQSHKDRNEAKIKWYEEKVKYTESKVKNLETKKKNMDASLKQLGEKIKKIEEEKAKAGK